MCPHNIFGWIAPHPTDLQEWPETWCALPGRCSRCICVDDRCNWGDLRGMWGGLGGPFIVRPQRIAGHERETSCQEERPSIDGDSPSVLTTICDRWLGTGTPGHIREHILTSLGVQPETPKRRVLKLSGTLILSPYMRTNPIDHPDTLKPRFFNPARKQKSAANILQNPRLYRFVERPLPIWAFLRN